MNEEQAGEIIEQVQYRWQVGIPYLLHLSPERLARELRWSPVEGVRLKDMKEAIHCMRTTEQQTADTYLAAIKRADEAASKQANEEATA